VAYSRDMYEEAMAELERRRAQAHAAAAALRERATARQPRLREIEAALAGAAHQVARAVLDGGDVDAAVERIKEENLSLQAEMASLLRVQGETAVDFEPVYTCPRCRDTGYAGGKICGCLEQLLREAACRRLSRTSNMTLTRFEDMDLGYYPDEPDPRTGISPRERMRGVLDYCRCYAVDFVPGAQSLLLRGPTGTGKTHVSLAIARTAAEKGCSVVYGPAQQLLRQLENEHFGRMAGDSAETLEACDLLILDDLGTEFSSPFTVSCIYNIINGRMLAGRSTVVSTNLSQQELLARYGEQTPSRITGTFQPLVFSGQDIRQLKLQEKIRGNRS